MGRWSPQWRWSPRRRIGEGDELAVTTGPEDRAMTVDYHQFINRDLPPRAGLRKCSEPARGALGHRELQAIPMSLVRRLAPRTPPATGLKIEPRPGAVARGAVEYGRG